MATPNKSLGQHWLHDPASLRAMCDLAEVGKDDTVLEIGPGLGTLTQQLTKRAKQVIAVEFDPELAQKLPSRVSASNLRAYHGDILQFELTQLPAGYKVVANVPYYITNKIVRLLLESPTSPDVSVLLVQKEVAERLAAQPGGLSILGVSAQFYASVSLGPTVPARLFTPPPKVDSQIVVLQRYQVPLFTDIADQDYFYIVKAGFSAKRKKLRSALAGGLRIEKDQAERLLQAAAIDPNKRAEMLTLQEWAQLVRTYKKIISK